MTQVIVLNHSNLIPFSPQIGQQADEVQYQTIPLESTTNLYMYKFKVQIPGISSKTKLKTITMYTQKVLSADFSFITCDQAETKNKIIVPFNTDQQLQLGNLIGVYENNGDFGNIVDQDFTFNISNGDELYFNYYGYDKMDFKTEKFMISLKIIE